MSYPKFLKAVMLGNGGKERIAEIIGNLQWSIRFVNVTRSERDISINRNSA